jgi:hypothetical protein
VIDDDYLGDAWTTLEPAAEQRRRMRARVLDWLEARDTSLAAEWLGLFKVAPIATTGLVAASGLSLVTATPVVWLARALL